MDHHEDTTPAVCDNCLGSNPYVDMFRQKSGAECKICTKPFTVFKWNADKGGVKNGKANLKKTVICLTCARSKNCCQSCLLDLTFGVDLETRDHLLKLAKIDNEQHDVVTNAKNVTSRLYNSNLHEDKFKEEQITHFVDDDEKMKKLESNLEDYIAGRQEKETQKSTSNVKDGISNKDLVSLVKHFPFNGNLFSKPKNDTIKSFFLFGAISKITMSDISDYFVKLSGAKYDKSMVSSISLEAKGKFGYVEFRTRALADEMASAVYEAHLKFVKCIKPGEAYKHPCLGVINNQPVRICWTTKLEMTSTGYSHQQLSKIAMIVDKQMVKLAKLDNNTNSLDNSKSNNTDKKSKVSK